MSHPQLARPDSSALVVIDVQEPFAKAMEERERVTRNIATLVQVARITDVPVVVTEQNIERLGPTVPELSAVLSELDLYDPINKVTFSCCSEEAFVQRVYDMGRDTLLLTGLEAHVCVQQTALDAMNLGYKVHVVSDAVTSRHRQDWTVAMDKLRMAGAIVSSTEMLAYELLGRGGTPQFKEAMHYLKW